MDVYSMIRQAILDKDIIIAVYQDRRREMCPHVLGRKGGKRHCLFYQFAGESCHGLERDGDRRNWRCLPVDDLRNVSVRKGDWHTADNHSGRQTCVDDLDVEVVY